MTTPPAPLLAHRIQQARLLLVGATLFWGLSFPLIRGLQLAQKEASPAVSDLSLALLDNLTRFSVAALLLSLVYGRNLFRVTWLEWSQGVGLAAFASCGLYLQTLGLSWTDASISAFLTQFYVLLVPLYIAVRDRRWPGWRVIGACLLVVISLGVLRPGLFNHFILGPGEGVTLLGTFFFAGQILWVERPLYRVNRAGLVTLVMFMAMSFFFLLGLFGLGGRGHLPLPELLGSGAPLGLMLAVIFGCTVFNFVIMNIWQPYVSATEASVIYCLEPVLAAVLSCFLPGLISEWCGIAYADEKLTWNLLLGGLGITCATLLIATKKTEK